MSKENGGPAFPQPLAEMNGISTAATDLSLGGMSLRDYFAAHAIQGIAAGSMVRTGWRSVSATNAGQAVRLAYEYADAMLKERAK